MLRDADQLTAGMDVPLLEVLPHLVRRTTVSLGVSIPLYFGATILGERMVGSVAVIHRGELAGELRFLDVLRVIYPMRDSKKTPDELLGIPVGQAMSTKPNKTDSRVTLKSLLRMIEASRSASVFIVDDHTVIGHVSLVDILQWLVLAKPKVETIAIDVSSKDLVSAPAGSPLGKIIELMLDRYVRKIIIRGDGMNGVVDDRGVTNMIFGSKHNRSTFSDIFESPVTEQVLQTKFVKSDASLVELAREILHEKSHSVLTRGNGIITPWDVAVRGLRDFVKAVPA